MTLEDISHNSTRFARSIHITKHHDSYKYLTCKMRCVGVGSFGQTWQWLWHRAYCMQKWASTFQYSQFELDISLIKKPKLSGKLQGRSKLQQSYPQLQIRSFSLTASGQPAIWTPNAQHMLPEEQDALSHNDRHLSFQTVAFIPAASGQ